jgi:5-formyltetrahydrofolate cyclo-ligase
MGDPTGPATAPDATASAKNTLRADIRVARARRTEDDRRRDAEALAQQALQRYGRAAVVAAYASYGTEPGTSQLRASLRSAGVRVLLPVVRGDQLAWVVDVGADLARGGERGMPEPDGAAIGVGAGALVAAQCTVLLLPALAAGLDGVRLGQGGGFYDRLLTELPTYPAGPLRVAVVHDDEVLPAGVVPAEPHDLNALVDEVLTPSSGPDAHQA